MPVKQHACSTHAACSHDRLEFLRGGRSRRTRRPCEGGGQQRPPTCVHPEVGHGNERFGAGQFVGGGNSIRGRSAFELRKELTCTSLYQLTRCSRGKLTSGARLFYSTKLRASNARAQSVTHAAVMIQSLSAVEDARVSLLVALLLHHHHFRQRDCRGLHCCLTCTPRVGRAP